MWVVLTTLLCAPLSIGVSFLKKESNLPHLVAKWWAKSILFVSRISVSVQGLHRIDPSTNYVYMANHQSMYDILVLLGCLPVSFRWLAKIELFRIPVFGYAMARLGCIAIDRSNRSAALRSLHQASRKIAQGVSVIVFPEGTRSTDGQVMPFKAGGFYLAIRSGRPIVPVVVCGTRHIMAKKNLRIRSGHVRISINPPVDTASHNDKGKAVLMESVRSIMKQDLERLQQADDLEE